MRPSSNCPDCALWVALTFRVSSSQNQSTPRQLSPSTGKLAIPVSSPLHPKCNRQQIQILPCCLRSFGFRSRGRRTVSECARGAAIPLWVSGYPKVSSGPQWGATMVRFDQSPSPTPSGRARLPQKNLLQNPIGLRSGAISGEPNVVNFVAVRVVNCGHFSGNISSIVV